MATQVLINGTQYSVNDEVAQAIALEHERQAVELNWLHMQLAELGSGHKVLDRYDIPSEDEAGTWIPISCRIKRMAEPDPVARCSPPPTREYMRRLRQRAENAESQLSNGHKAFDAQGIPSEDSNGKLSIAGRVMKFARMLVYSQGETAKWRALVPSPSMLRELARAIHIPSGPKLYHSLATLIQDATALAVHIEEAQLRESQSDFDEESD